MLPLKQSIASVLFCLLLLTSVAESSLGKEPYFPAAKHGQGELRYIQGIPVAIVAGTPTEIGAQRAALLAKPGAAMLKFPRKMFAAAGAEQYWPLAVMASKQLLQQAPARYRAEMAAVAKQANISIDALEVGNTLLELRRMGCSTLIIEPTRSATGGPLFGRNFDFPPLGVLDKYSLVTIVHPHGKHSFAAVGYPGLLGVLSGMNDAGLAVATLDVYASSNGSPKFDPTGTPQMFVFRQILEECTTVAETEALLQQTKASTWSNLAVCDRQRGAVFEITPTEVVRRNSQKSVLPCTNHFRTADLATQTDCWRYQSLQAAAGQTQLDVQAVHRHLHQANQGELTLHTMVFEPRELALHVAFGNTPSSALPLKHLDLQKLLSTTATATQK